MVWILDNTSFLPENLLPLIGAKRCWLQQNRIVELIYVYTPISLILIINITLYSITAYKIFRVQKETSVIRNGESQKHSKIDADKDRLEWEYFLLLKIFKIFSDFSFTCVCLLWWAPPGVWNQFLGYSKRNLCFMLAISWIVCRALLYLYFLYGSRKSRNFLRKGKL